LAAGAEDGLDKQFTPQRCSAAGAARTVWHENFARVEPPGGRVLTGDAIRRITEMGHGDHACAIHDDPQQGIAAAVLFIKEGLRRGERCVYVSPESAAAPLIRALGAGGVDTARVIEQGALRIVHPGPSILQGGKLGPEAMVGLLDRLRVEALGDGFSGLRIMGEMEWTRRAPTDDGRVLVFECIVNQFMKGSTVVALCQYQRSHFDLAVEYDVLRTHPVAIIGELALPNPYYEPPELILSAEREPRAQFKRKRVDWWLSRLSATAAAEKERERALAELRIRDEQLRQSQRLEAVGRLATGIAHDFNNQLTIVNGCADLLAHTLGNSSEADLAKEIKEAGKRSAWLTGRLLSFSRKTAVAPRPLDLNALVNDTCRMIRRMIGENIELRLSLAPALDAVRADPGQMEQILLNLAVNARDAMPNGGELRITTENAQPAGGRSVKLVVADTGEGMTEEVRARLFEPFFTTKAPGKGTGLGLAVVHGIVEECGGRVEVRSRPGAGTTFEILLPSAGAVPAPAAPAAEADAPRGTETVLLVEDDEGVRSVIRRGLAAYGYAVLEAGRAEEALALCAARKEPIHLLISDVILPGMGGREMAEKAVEVRPDMKVLFVSGFIDDPALRHRLRVGRVEFLQKPFSARDLAQKVHDLLAARAESRPGHD
jgi:signal transduction histidine kinase/ActR/RegA family two-component response regulator